MYGVLVNICNQATDIVGELITDMNLMLTGGDESKMTFFIPCKIENGEENGTGRNEK